MVHGCSTVTRPSRFFCHRCFARLNSALSKTLIFLWREGRPRDGFAEAVENAEAQLRAMEIRSRRPRPQN